MGTFVRTFVLLSCISLVWGGLTADEVTSPKFLESLEKWWGPGEETTENTDIRPFKIEFTDEMIEDLRHRLNNRRAVTPPLKGVAFEYGFNTNNLDYWADFWANKYNFTEREEYLNQFPQYKTNIQGLDIHFLWVKPEVPEGVETIPLLLLHGWPGSVREMFEAIPLITKYSEERDFAVEVIVPSLPGFGFSDGTTLTGLGEAEVAVVLRNLMRRLNFEKFYIQGGDFGALIANNMVTFYPKEILGYHTNFPVSLAPGSLITYAAGALKPSLVVDPALADRMYPIKKVLLFYMEEFGYMHMQATKPDTIGVAMSDSPSALLAWILQSISGGTNRSNKHKPDGGLRDTFTSETIIDDIMFYWVPNSFTTAIRLYAESLNLRTIKMGIASIPTTVPTCTIHAKYEIIYETRNMLEFKFKNLLRATVLDDYGHFLAMEAPEVLAKDLLSALVEFRKYNNKNESSNCIEL